MHTKSFNILMTKTMKKITNLSALFLIVLASVFGACAQDEAMDDIIDNTEINAPSDGNGEQGGNGGGEDGPGDIG